MVLSVWVVAIQNARKNVTSTVLIFSSFLAEFHKGVARLLGLFFTVEVRSQLGSISHNFQLPYL